MLSNIKSFTLYISIYLCIQMQSNALALPSFFLNAWVFLRNCLLLPLEFPKLLFLGLALAYMTAE